MGKRNFYQSNIEEPVNENETPVEVIEETKAEEVKIEEPKKEEPKVEVKPAEPVKPVKKEEPVKRRTATI